MKSVEESVVIAMDGVDKELFPYLPYILQDIWEIGSDPETIIDLIGNHFNAPENLKILDLGCGKGAVSVKVAQRYKCFCHGIDAIAEFITFAQGKAAEYQVEEHCKFQLGDIREVINTLPRYDIIILGAIGPVFGDYQKSLTTLKKHLLPGGAFIIDDAYIENASEFTHPLVLKYDELVGQIKNAGMELAEILPAAKEEVVDADDIILSSLKTRCLQLAEKYPEKEQLFTDYIRKQEIESDINANKIVCATMIIKEADCL